MMLYSFADVTLTMAPFLFSKPIRNFNPKLLAHTSSEIKAHHFNPASWFRRKQGDEEDEDEVSSFHVAKKSP